MGSRITNNQKHVFYCFMEVAPPSEEGGKSRILKCYPENYLEKNKIPEFVYPCTFNVTTVELFSFALTNMEGKLTFGFARHAPRAQSALVVVSALPWHDFFYKLLNNCAQIINNPGGEEEPELLNKFLSDLYNSKLPRPGTDYSLEYGGMGKVFTSGTPDPTRLPGIPDNRNLSEYFNFVDINNMITIFFSMLNERRVIVTSRKISRLSACIQAANSLLYPLSWQYLYIPVLPAPMIDFLTAPVPFIMGVPDVTLNRKPPSEISEVVILDADNNTVRNPFEDVDIFPPEVASNLKKSLKEKDKLGDHVARAFLQATVHLIGGYRDAMRYRQGEKITFDADAFVQSRSSSLQPFLTKLLQIQMFQTFKDERLELLNGGKGYSDEFELECVAFSEKASLRRFTPFDSVKKDGGALMKKVKNKTNPVMKNVIDGSKKAGERVRDRSKIAKTKAKATINEVKSKFRDNHEQFREDSSSSTHSAPSSPSQSRRSSVNNYQTLQNNPIGNFGRQHTDLGLSTAAASGVASSTSTTAPILKYERFDPSKMSASIKSPPGGHHLSPIASDDFNLMQDIDEVFNKQKPSAIYCHIGSTSNDISVAPSSVQHDTRKSSVGDLINLSHDNGDGDSDIFDPFSSHHQSSSSNQNYYGSTSYTSPPSTVNSTASASNHKKLSRSGASATGLSTNSQSTNIYPSSATPNSFLYPSTSNHQHTISKNSEGKYENYVPAGGANHQQQFKHFVSSLTDTKSGHSGKSNVSEHQSLKRSSEDLLKDYGLLEFSSLHIGNKTASQNTDISRSTNLLSSGVNGSSLHATSTPYNNGIVSSNNLTSTKQLATTTPSSDFPFNGLIDGNNISTTGVYSAGFPQPPPRCSAGGPPPPTIQPRLVSTQGSSMRNGLNGSADCGGVVDVNISRGGNNSFLFNSSPIQPASNFQINNIVGNNLPVNQRLETTGNTTRIGSSTKKSIYSTSTTTNNNNNHFLSDLDPLCSSGKPTLERTHLTPSPSIVNCVVPGGIGGPSGPGGPGSGLDQRQPPAIPPRVKKQWTTFEN